MRGVHAIARATSGGLVGLALACADRLTPPDYTEVCLEFCAARFECIGHEDDLTDAYCPKACEKPSSELVDRCREQAAVDVECRVQHYDCTGLMYAWPYPTEYYGPPADPCAAEHERFLDCYLPALEDALEDAYDSSSSDSSG